MTNQPEVYVIFGATGSVGSSLCEMLVRSGAKVVAGVRDAERASEMPELQNCDICVATAADPQSLAACLDHAISTHGALTGVANCIGSVLLKPAHLTSDDEWHDTLTTNLTSSFFIVRAAAKQMRQTGGSIVLVSSSAARIGLANHEAIAAAKAGIIGLTLSSAATYAGRGIRVNAVAPGLVRSNMTRKLWETPEAAALSAQMHALGRLGEPVDVARAIKWLLDPESGWVTGQTVGIDGGLGSVLTRMKM
jgi:NAD(P)-dependent dehydrogenase (short-subunit alcohol dehydrogenase family)